MSRVCELTGAKANNGMAVSHSHIRTKKLLKLIFNKDNGKVLGAHIFGLHAADLIQEISNAISRNQDVIELSKEVHTHPTLSEVVEVAYKQAASQIK